MPLGLVKSIKMTIIATRTYKVLIQMSLEPLQHLRKGVGKKPHSASWCLESRPTYSAKCLNLLRLSQATLVQCGGYSLSDRKLDQGTASLTSGQHGHWL